MIITHARTHARTHTYTRKQCKRKTKPPAAMRNIAITAPLGCLCTTQALKPCAADPPGAGLVTRRRTVQVSWREVVEPSTTTSTPLSETRTLGHCFPSLHQVPIDVTAGWAASPVDTRPPGPHLNSWVDWNNVRKVSCSRKQQKHQSGSNGNRTWDLRLPGRCPNHLAMLHTHIYSCMHTVLFSIAPIML